MGTGDSSFAGSRRVQASFGINFLLREQGKEGEALEMTFKREKTLKRETAVTLLLVGNFKPQPHPYLFTLTLTRTSTLTSPAPLN